VTPENSSWGRIHPCSPINMATPQNKPASRRPFPDLTPAKVSDVDRCAGQREKPSEALDMRRIWPKVEAGATTKKTQRSKPRRAVRLGAECFELRGASYRLR